MTRDDVIARLQAWSRRAQNEALEADTRPDLMNWQGQAQALSSVSNLLIDQGDRLDDTAIWKRVVMDREASMAAWLAQGEGPDADYHAGQVAGYDVALTALTNLTGRQYTHFTGYTQ